HHLIPLLDELMENGKSRVMSSLSLLAEDTKAYDEMVKKLVKTTETGIEICLDEIPENQCRTWVYHCLREFGFNRIQCSNLLDGKIGSFIESGDFKAQIHKNQVIVRNVEKFFEETQINSPGEIQIQNGQTLRVDLCDFIRSEMPKSSTHIWLDFTVANFPLTIRRVLPNEKFQPLGSSYSVIIRDYLKDRK